MFKVCFIPTWKQFQNSSILAKLTPENDGFPFFFFLITVMWRTFYPLHWVIQRLPGILFVTKYERSS